MIISLVSWGSEASKTTGTYPRFMRLSLSATNGLSISRSRFVEPNRSLLRSARSTPTRKKTAEQFQVSERRLQSATEIERENPQLADRVLSGDLTLPQARQELRREQKRAELETKAAEVEEAVASKPSWEVRNGECEAVLPDLQERARLIFADPPYNIGVDYGDGKIADRLYGRHRSGR